MSQSLRRHGQNRRKRTRRNRSDDAGIETNSTLRANCAVAQQPGKHMRDDTTERTKGGANTLVFKVSSIPLAQAHEWLTVWPTGSIEIAMLGCDSPTIQKRARPHHVE